MRKIVVIILSLGCFVISCNNNEDWPPETLFKSAQLHWEGLQEGMATDPEGTVEVIDDLLIRTEKTRADLGMTSEKLEEAISNCYVHKAREYWGYFAWDDNIIKNEKYWLKRMDEALAKAEKTRADIGITPDRFQIVMREYHHKAVRYYWLKMVEAHERGSWQDPKFPGIVEYHLAAIGMTREEFRIPEEKWQEIVHSIKNK